MRRFLAILLTGLAAGPAAAQQFPAQAGAGLGGADPQQVALRLRLQFGGRPSPFAPSPFALPYGQPFPSPFAFPRQAPRRFCFTVDAFGRLRLEQPSPFGDYLTGGSPYVTEGSPFGGSQLQLQQLQQLLAGQLGGAAGYASPIAGGGGSGRLFTREEVAAGLAEPGAAYGYGGTTAGPFAPQCVGGNCPR